MKLKLQKERKKREEYQANSQIYNNKQKRLIYNQTHQQKRAVLLFLKRIFTGKGNAHFNFDKKIPKYFFWKEK